MIDDGRLRQALRAQAAACASLASPFMERLCRLLADRLQPGTPLCDRLFGWPGDLGPSGQSLPLRLAGAMHALVLGGDRALASVYPPNAPDDAQLSGAVLDALSRHAGYIERFIDQAPQTNEVRRAAALIAAGHWLAARHPLPMVLSELGASAGLNLMWDRFALQTPTHRLGPQDAALTLSPDWRGRPAPSPAQIHVAERSGVDIHPLDLMDPAQKMRLLAYLWADQPHRRDLTEAAIGCAPPCPDRADAVDWLETRLAARPGQLHLIWTTIAWQYFPETAQARGQALIEAAGARATDDAPLAWLSYEADGQGPGAALVLRSWPGDLVLALGRADFHGRWIDWQAAPPH